MKYPLCLAFRVLYCLRRHFADQQALTAVLEANALPLVPAYESPQLCLEMQQDLQERKRKRDRAKRREDAGGRRKKHKKKKHKKKKKRKKKQRTAETSSDDASSSDTSASRSASDLDPEDPMSHFLGSAPVVTGWQVRLLGTGTRLFCDFPPTPRMIVAQCNMAQGYNQPQSRGGGGGGRVYILCGAGRGPWHPGAKATGAHVVYAPCSAHFGGIPPPKTMTPGVSA